ncbi:protein LIFEGUARD 2 [Populus alba x Populus x berolinensis]|uniref:Protein LIFEGUARD 2 n=1 Tax=Populus alba x Populus x berolinensis TaxID=444605 RepID=A0AAD6RC18_9ROSI|nr:protein LIFEGUARD 2 [Populus alba x Populus x berolinensis]
MWAQPYGKTDLEAGARPLYPMMLESPQLRWAFIRKVYSILCFQLLLTIAVAAMVVSIRPIAVFFSTTGAGLALYIVLILTPFITLLPMYYYHQKHPVNYFLLGIFTISLAFAVGLTCAFTEGKVILESAILTTVVVVSLTMYTFWAARRGHDFNFLGPFLFGAVMVLMVFAFIQILFPLGRISVMIYGCLASIIFCGYIIYDTDNLIKRYSYDEYIWASKGDVEFETYPAVLDGPRNCWIFIRKVYIIIVIQLLVTVAVANTVVLAHPISSLSCALRRDWLYTEGYFAFCHHNFCGRGLSHSVHFLGGKETEKYFCTNSRKTCTKRKEHHLAKFYWKKFGKPPFSIK